MEISKETEEQLFITPETPFLRMTQARWDAIPGDIKDWHGSKKWVHHISDSYISGYRKVPVEIIPEEATQQTSTNKGIVVSDPNKTTNFITVICREGVSEVTPFEFEDDARRYYGRAQENWSESFLCKVLMKGMVES